MNGSWGSVGRNVDVASSSQEQPGLGQQSQADEIGIADGETRPGTPLLPGVEQLVREARRLKLPVSWEVDDLIFDAAVLHATPTLRELDHHSFRGLLKGAGLYRRALQRADRGIASTPALGQAMAAVGGFPVDVIHNGLDTETLNIMEELRLHHPGCDRELDTQAAVCRVVYGSGTNTHNQNVLVATEALLALLRDRPHLRLRIVGDLKLPPSFKTVSNQIERFHARDPHGVFAEGGIPGCSGESTAATQARRQENSRLMLWD